MHVRKGPRDDTRGERRCIELVLRVENECRVETLAVQFLRGLVVQHVQEMAGDAVVIRLGVDALAFGLVTVPVQQHRRQAGEQPVRDVLLVGEVALGLDVAKERDAGTQHVHRMRVRRHHLQHRLQLLGQAAVRLDLRDVSIQLGPVGELAVQYQVRHLLEIRVVCEIVDVVAAVGEAGAFFADGTKMRCARCYSGQSAGFLCCCHVTVSFPPPELSYFLSSIPSPGTTRPACPRTPGTPARRRAPCASAWRRPRLPACRLCAAFRRRSTRLPTWP